MNILLTIVAVLVCLWWVVASLCLFTEETLTDGSRAFAGVMVIVGIVLTALYIVFLWI